MSDDLIGEWGALALASRLRRLSEVLQKEVSEVYSVFDTKFEARWFPIVYLLKEKTEVSVTRAAELLGLSHPAIIQIAKPLQKKGLVVSVNDSRDQRRRLLRLSPEGGLLVEKLRPIWRAIEDSTLELIEGSPPNLIQALTLIENRLKEQSIRNRILEELSASASIEEAGPECFGEFRRLNLLWLSEYFCVEPEDEELLQDPQARIIDKGGRVLAVMICGRPIGFAALILRDQTTFELAKMTVRREFRGLDLGKKLLAASVQLARNLGGKRLYLLTSPLLEVAVGLYERSGFKRSESGDQTGGYGRCSIEMELEL